MNTQPAVIPETTTAVDANAGAQAPELMPVAIEISNVSKRYAMFAKPEDRLKQMVVPRLQRLARAEPARYFREFSAVENVSLTVRRGETVGIIGRNGSGKSTLLQMIVGTLTPTSGTVQVHGRIAALLELGAGFNPEFTGRENVYVNGAILGFSREEMDEKFGAIAAFAAIGEFIERPVKTYSSGMFVRLAFAVSTAVEPDILVIDEALSVGDEAFQRKCFARIEAIKARGGTILFVSHGAQTITQLCDRAVLMEAGENILEGEPKLVVGQYQRLVNASEEGAAKIKADIFALRGSAHIAAVAADPPEIEGSSLETPSLETQTLVEPQNPIKALNLDANEDDGLADYFDPNLQSESTVYHEERGARISNVHITTLGGKKVNILRSGQYYTARFSIEIIDPMPAIDFGLTIRSTIGLALSGYSTRNSKYELKIAHAGSHYQIEMRFKNNFLSGVYFLSTSLFRKSEFDEHVAHSIRDAFMFRVPCSRDICNTGFIDSEFSIVVNTNELLGL